MHSFIVRGYCPTCGYTGSLTVMPSMRLKHRACGTYTGKVYVPRTSPAPRAPYVHTGFEAGAL